MTSVLDLNERGNLLRQLKDKFEELKSELGFKSSFHEIDKIFYIQDSILNAGFVAESFDRQICARIVDTYMGWNNYLHNLVMPDSHSMIQMNESKLLNDVDKKEILQVIADSMRIVSMNLVIGIGRDKNVEAQFIDNSVEFWNRHYSSSVFRIVKKINDGWNK